ncbi:MAG: DUF4623 domain-containing protein, partial [Bacteroidetes bacterium]|nr:DUF4623 domain-containing protein [Bacteroidota bacterium]
KQKIKRGNRYSVVARIQAFNGKVQIREERTGHPTPAFTDLGPGMPIIPKVVTVKELNDNGELYENSLVAVKNINFTATSPVWPAAGATGTALNLRVTDNGTDTVTMRPAEFGGLSGNPIPGPWPLVVGVAGQFDASSPRLWDYQFIPRDSNDFKYVPKELALPLNFDSTNVAYDFINFSGATTTRIANPFSTGLNTSPYVARTVKGAGDPWAGSYLALAKPVDLTKGKIFKAKVYMPKVGAKMLLKLENGTNGGINMEINATGTKANQWEELTWDFSAIDATKEYHKVVVIFDLGTVGDGGANFTYYFDDIQQTLPPPSTVKPLFPVWSRSKASGAMPLSFIPNGNYERGMAVGRVGGKDRLYVVSRSGGPKIVTFDARSGDSVGVVFQSTSFSSGTFPLNAVDVSDDGVIFASNMTIDAANGNFKVYRWNSETDTPKTVIDYNGADLPASSRMGDMISVFGKASDNTLAIYAGVSGQDNVVKFTTTDFGKTFTKSIIQLSTGPNGTMPSIAQMNDGTIYVKSYTKKLSRYDDLGNLIDTISGSIVGSDATNIKAFERNGRKYIIAYSPNDGTGTTDERFTVVNVTNPKAPVIEFASPSLGNSINGNATGAVDFMTVDTNYIFYILGTNNGFAAFTPAPMLALSTMDTLFYGDTPTLLKNPFGAGYVAGVNSYKDIGKYQRFDLKPNDVLAAFRAYFGVKQIVGTPDTVTMVVRSKKAAAPGAPDSLLQTIPFTTDVMDTTMEGNLFFLKQPVKTNGPLYIGFEWSAAGDDTFAILSDKDGEGDKAGRAWERFEDGSFNDFGTLLNPTFSWDLDVDLGIEAYYRKSTLVGVEDVTTMVPSQYVLEQNYPNPFNPATTIRFALPAMGSVRLTVYDILGRQVRTLMNGEAAAGYHSVVWDGRNDLGRQVATGMYIYRIESGSFISTKKMMLLK